MRVLLAVCTLVASTAQAGEGKWTPQQVLDQGPAWVKAQGFRLPLKALWDAKKGGGLLSNAVQLPGCSGSFVSKDGLLITNHHCVVGILQEHSTPEANLVKDGYLARTRADEKKASAYRIQVPKAFRDVTKEVLAAIPEGADDLARFLAVETAEKTLVAECEKTPDARCSFAVFDGGLFFTLTEFRELKDVRLVYAPPGAVGDFGGEVDNWMWPRHSGDFALLRAFDGETPYRPDVFFPVSKDGVKAGDAVAVLGYPGRSFRALLADEVVERQEKYFPASRDLSADWIAILEAEGARKPEVAIAVADELRSLLNRRKNAEGQLAGLKRGQIVQKQRAAEARVLAATAQRNDQAALTAHAELTALNTERMAAFDRDFLLDASGWGCKSLVWPTTLARRAVEAKLPDLEREAGFMERDLTRLSDRLARDQKRYAPEVDRRLFAHWVERALALPKGHRIEAVDKVFGAGASSAKVLSTIDGMMKASQVADPAARAAMLKLSPEALAARGDPLLTFGLALDVERRALRDVRRHLQGAVLRLRPVWRRAVIAEAGGRAVAPDANSSLRVTFGRVAGYSPRDAVTMSPHTTLAGALEKHTGVEPFDLPARIREAYEKGLSGPKPKAVPVNFLADCDTTGGNSGSPVIDGRGRLVGVNFDRVWENVANDFGYNPDVARNVSADVRYLLWLLAEVEGATQLLTELGLGPSFPVAPGRGPR